MNPLSIFSFKTLKDWLKVPVAGLLCLCFIAIAALVVKLTDVEHYMPSPYFPRYEFAYKYLTLKTYIDYGMNPEVVFIGSSVANMGFDALTFERYLKFKGKKLNAFNFGINGAGPRVFYRLLKDVIIPETDVRYIFYGLSPIEFNSKSKIFLSDQEKFLDSPYYAKESGEFFPVARLKRFLFKHFLLYRLSGALWSNYFSDKTTWIDPGEETNRYLAFNGQNRILPPMWRNWADSWQRPRLGKKRIDRLEDLLGNYSTDDNNIRELKKVIRLCRTNNIKLFLVSMPVIRMPLSLRNNVYMNMIRAGANGVVPILAFEKAFHKICSGDKVSCINAVNMRGLTLSDFFDPLHLYYTGAIKFARPLADYLLRNP